MNHSSYVPLDLEQFAQEVVTDSGDDTMPRALFAVKDLRVKQAHGLSAGRCGKVEGYARSQAADKAFKQYEAHAKAEGIDIPVAAYERLIDAEGPLIRWDNSDEIDWFPGQSMGLLAPEEA